MSVGAYFARQIQKSFGSLSSDSAAAEALGSNNAMGKTAVQLFFITHYSALRRNVMTPGFLPGRYIDAP